MSVLSRIKFRCIQYGYVIPLVIHTVRTAIRARTPHIIAIVTDVYPAGSLCGTASCTITPVCCFDLRVPEEQESLVSIYNVLPQGKCGIYSGVSCLCI